MLSNPACFGSPVAISHICPTCRACDANVACARSAEQALLRMPESPLLKSERLRIAVVRQALTSVPLGAVEGEGAPRAKPNRLPLSAQQEEFIASLPQQVASMVRKLQTRGWFEFARSEMLAGRNPGRNDWQKILCAKLIAGGVSRKDLALAYESQLRMTPGSAKVRVSKAVSVFTAGGLLVELSSCLYLRQN